MFLARDLKRSFSGKLALNGFTLDASDVQVLGLVGPNGSGKSTLAHILVGLIDQSSGSFRLVGDEQKDLAMQFQNVPLFSSMTVVENCKIYFAMNQRTFSLSQVDNLLQFWLLGDKKGVLVSKLSGGQRQALSICLTMISEPKFLILDEPMNNLDPQARVFVREQIKRLSQNGVKVLLISHDLSEIDKVVDTLAFCNQGKVVASGPIDHLKQSWGAGSIEDLYTKLLGQGSQL